jgi:hypothetical protein
MISNKIHKRSNPKYTKTVHEIILWKAIQKKNRGTWINHKVYKVGYSSNGFVLDWVGLGKTMKIKCKQIVEQVTYDKILNSTKVLRPIFPISPFP